MAAENEFNFKTTRIVDGDSKDGKCVRLQYLQLPNAFSPERKPPSPTGIPASFQVTFLSEIASDSKTTKAKVSPVATTASPNSSKSSSTPAKAASKSSAPIRVTLLSCVDTPTKGIQAGYMVVEIAGHQHKFHVASPVDVTSEMDAWGAVGVEQEQEVIFPCNK